MHTTDPSASSGVILTYNKGQTCKYTFVFSYLCTDSLLCNKVLSDGLTTWFPTHKKPRTIEIYSAKLYSN